MIINKFDDLVLSLCATTKGFAFTLFEAPLTPVDWGIKDIRGSDKNARAMNAIARLIERLHPTTIVIEDFEARSMRRSRRIRRLYRLVENLARCNDLEFRRYSRDVVRKCFRDSGAISRREIAQAIGSLIPVFSPHVPPMRKIWMSEDPRLSLFDAAALALTYYADISGIGPDDER